MCFSVQLIESIVSDPIWREADRAYITREIQSLEYAKAPDVFFLSDHYDIRQKLREYDGITLLIGSSLEREAALELDIRCHVMSFPVSDQLVLNRTYAGYRGSLTLVENLFNNL